MNNKSEYKDAADHTPLLTYKGPVLQKAVEEDVAVKEQVRKEKNEQQKLVSITLSALIKRALKAKHNLVTKHKLSSEKKTASTYPVPLEYIEALKLHCQHNSRSYSEESIYGEFFSTVEREMTLGHTPLQCLFLVDSFVHHSDVFRNIVAENIQKFIVALEKAGLFVSALSSSMKECRDYLLEIIDVWGIAFGQTQKSFVMLKRYLRESLQLQAPTIEERVMLIEKRNRSKQQKVWEELISRTERILHRSWPDAEQEISTLLQRVNESFQALFTEEEPAQTSSTTTLYDNNSKNSYVSVANNDNSNNHDQHSKTTNNKPVSSSNQVYTQQEINMNRNGEDDGFWDNIEWESDETVAQSQNDDDSMDDLFGENLLIASANMTGDITIVIDPGRSQTYRGTTNEKEQERKEKYTKDIYKAVATAAKHLLALYKLLSKWKSFLQRFQEEVQSREKEFLEEQSFWQLRKKRRILSVVPSNESLGLGAQTPAIAAVATLQDTLPNNSENGNNAVDEPPSTNGSNIEGKAAPRLFGKDTALVETLYDKADTLVQTDIPQLQGRIKSLVDNQIRALLFRN